MRMFAGCFMFGWSFATSIAQGFTNQPVAAALWALVAVSGLFLAASSKKDTTK